MKYLLYVIAGLIGYKLASLGFIVFNIKTGHFSILNALITLGVVFILMKIYNRFFEG